MPTSFDTQASEFIKSIFVENGICVLTGKKVTKLFESDGKKMVALDDGETVSGDMLVISTGINPNINFLAGSGIDCKDGVVVDNRMRTSVPMFGPPVMWPSAVNFFLKGKASAGPSPVPLIRE